MKFCLFLFISLLLTVAACKQDDTLPEKVVPDVPKPSAPERVPVTKKLVRRPFTENLSYVFYYDVQGRLSYVEIKNSYHPYSIDYLPTGEIDESFDHTRSSFHIRHYMNDKKQIVQSKSLEPGVAGLHRLLEQNYVYSYDDKGRLAAVEKTFVLKAGPLLPEKEKPKDETSVEKITFTWDEDNTLKKLMTKRNDGSYSETHFDYFDEGRVNPLAGRIHPLGDMFLYIFQASLPEMRPVRRRHEFRFDGRGNRYESELLTTDVVMDEDGYVISSTHSAGSPSTYQYVYMK